MHIARAFQINASLVTAWMIWNGMERGEVPCLRGISLTDAIEATKLVQADRGMDHSDGTRTITCCVEPTLVPKLYAWAILQTEQRP